MSKLLFLNGLFLSCLLVVSIMLIVLDTSLWRVAGFILALTSIVMFVLLLRKNVHNYVDQKSKVATINTTLLIISFLLLIAYGVYCFFDKENTILNKILYSLPIIFVFIGLFIQRKQLTQKQHKYIQKE